jgi:predicted amidohydrolase
MSLVLPAAIEVIKERAALALEKGDYEPIHLAAHLFAVCLLVLKDQRVPEHIPWEGEKAAGTLEETLANLTKLTPDLGPEPLYRRLIQGLQVIESHFSPYSRPSESLAFPSYTELEPLAHENRPPVRGTIRHWLRPWGTKLAALRRSRYDAAPANRPLPPASSPLDHLDTLRFLWVSDPKPDVSVVSHLGRDLSLVEDSGYDATKGSAGFRIALCPLADGFHPLFAVGSKGDTFAIGRSEPYQNQESLKTHLVEVLEAARNQVVHLIVFPELCIPPEIRNFLSAWLQGRRSRVPYGVIAGSFHIWPSGLESLPFNESVLLHHPGLDLLRHRKRGRYKITRGAAAKSPLFRPPSGVVMGEILEGIAGGSQLQILETSLGTLAILICADALETDPHGYVPLVRELRPDLLFLVSMSHETGPFELFAEEMAKQWIGTVFVNAHCICTPPTTGNPSLAICNLALYEPEGEAPTYFRWRYEHTPEIFNFRSSKPPKGWPDKARPEELSGAGLSWLGGKKELGLVVDLGVHWSQG